MADEHKRLCHVERNRMWTSWSATIPLLIGMLSIVAWAFWGAFSLLTTAVISVVFGAAGLALIYLAREDFAILPFVYCSQRFPGKNFVVVSYKTYWGTSRGMHHIWQEAVRVVPGVYRLRGKTFEAATGDMFRCPDIFHDDDEYDESEQDNDV